MEHVSWVGYICTCARVDMPRFPYIGNGWRDCPDIWFVIIDPLAYHFTKGNGGIQVHVCTCTALFLYLGNDNGLR